MNMIEKLVEEFCPNGVEFKALGEVCEIADNKRKPVKSSLRMVGKTPYYGANNIQDYVEGFTHNGEYVLLAEDGSASLDNYSVQYTTGKFWANNHVHVIRGFNEVLNKFLFYWCSNIDFIPFLTGGTRAKLTKSKMINIKIPIPPLTIQKEIVKILDHFTNLEAELEAELEARKKQYEYYRDALLRFGDDVPVKALGEVLQRTKGTPITAKKMNKINKKGAPIKIFAGGKTVAYVNYGDIPEKDVLTIESVVVKSRGIIEFEYINKPFSHKNEFWSYHSNNSEISIKYIFYYLKNKEYYFQSVGKRMSKMPQLSIPDTEKFKIPIPPLSKQKEIVSILDKFDALVNDISVGLPAEIAARKKQYEYYRNQLLTFKPLAV